MSKYFRNFDEWSDFIDRKYAKAVKAGKVKFAKVDGGVVAKIGKVEIASYTLKVGGAVY